LSSQDAGGEEDIVAVAEWSENIDAVLGDSRIYNTCHEFRMLVNGMPCYQATERVRNDNGASLLRRYSRLVAR
jgi:hypothetical protein